jgi:DNA-binding Xre family transcriptional regulator
MHFLMLSPLETGKRRRVLRQTLEKLARALECSPQELIASDTACGEEDGARDA